MADSNNSIVTGKFRGTLGREVVFRDWDGKTIVAKLPKKSKCVPNAAALAKREKFSEGAKYAKAILSNVDQSLVEAYAASLRPRQNVYSRALQDFVKSPVVSKIETHDYNGTPGSKIVARAKDDFRVVGLRIEIYAVNGSLLESGNAILLSNSLDWAYTATVANNPVAGTRIKAIAKDVPGNEGALEMIL